jgi:hypothetical protein
MSSEDSRFRRIARPSEPSVSPRGILRRRVERATAFTAGSCTAQLRGKRKSASRGRSATAARGGGRCRRAGTVEAEAGGGGPMGLSRAWNWKPSNSGPESLPAVKLSRAALTGQLYCCTCTLRSACTICDVTFSVIPSQTCPCVVMGEKLSYI